MAERKPPRRERCEDVSHSEFEKLLNEAGIWDFDTFGWLSAYDIDPEFAGHARWQVNPPIDFDPPSLRDRPANRQPSPPETAEWLKLLAVSGADFVGLMKAARLSMGLLLMETKSVRAFQFSNDQFFDLHWMSSIIYLATASERLSEFLIAAAFRKSHDAYFNEQKKLKRKLMYTSPFLEAKIQFSASSNEIIEALNRLEPITASILELRTQRNILIHQLATKIGKQEHKRLHEPTRARGLRDFATFQRDIKESEVAHRKELDRTVKQLAAWYLLLARASNEVFLFEAYRRGDTV